jgi:hypothetical protein
MKSSECRDNLFFQHRIRLLPSLLGTRCSFRLPRHRRSKGGLLTPRPSFFHGPRDNDGRHIPARLVSLGRRFWSRTARATALLGILVLRCSKSGHRRFPLRFRALSQGRRDAIRARPRPWPRSTTGYHSGGVPRCVRDAHRTKAYALREPAGVDNRAVWSIMLIYFQRSHRLGLLVRFRSRMHSQLHLLPLLVICHARRPDVEPFESAVSGLGVNQRLLVSLLPRPLQLLEIAPHALQRFIVKR